MDNMMEKYQKAQIAAQVAGAIVIENVMACCRGCVDIEIPEGKPHAWSFAGQGCELVWESGRPMFAPEDEEEDEDDDEGGGYSWSDSRASQSMPAEGVYWYHGAGGGALISQAFKDAGFDVEWDGTDMNAVLVKFA